MTDAVTIHATCVAIAGKGVLILGESGSGKSDLALRLIDGGAALVADDRVMLARSGDVLMASAPERLAGMIEARGVGIARMAHQGETALTLAVQCVAREHVERLPEPQQFDCLGLKLPLVSLHAFDGSTPAKIRLALSAQLLRE